MLLDCETLVMADKADQVFGRPFTRSRASAMFALHYDQHLQIYELVRLRVAPYRDGRCRARRALDPVTNGLLREYLKAREAVLRKRRRSRKVAELWVTASGEPLSRQAVRETLRRLRRARLNIGYD